MSRNAALGLSSQSRTFLQRHDQVAFSYPGSSQPLKRRCFHSSSPAHQSARTGERQHDAFTADSGDARAGLGNKAKEKLEDREFFLSLLSSASTKREARSYLSRFKDGPPSPASDPRTKEQNRACRAKPDPVLKSGVNLGNIFGPSRAVDESPVFRQTSTAEISKDRAVTPEKLHIALVKLTEPQLLDDKTLHGVARTLSQLKRLGMSCCVVVDVGDIANTTAWRETANTQADRLAGAIDANHGSESRRLDSILSLPSPSSDAPSVLLRSLLLSPLRQNKIVVIVPVGYTQDGQRAVPITADQAMLALSKELAGLEVKADPNEDVSTTSQRIQNLQTQVSMDRLIILEPFGGLPALKRPAQGSHVFVNLEQEYDDIVGELKEGVDAGPDGAAGRQHTENERSAPSLGKSNPLSQFVEEEVVPLPSEQARASKLPGQRSKQELIRHINNLKLLRQSLMLLPPSSSAIVTTPDDAANSAKAPDSPSQFSTVGTRRRRNPLIHNLLTDKPAHSSSLPVGRLGVNKDSAVPTTSPVVRSTFVKKGMPLTLLPDPRVQLWTPGVGDGSRMGLDDPRIDLPRLVHLIEDSFDRELDVRHYMERVKDRLAGLIIAGEYEGGAVLTWETPPGAPDDGSAESLSRMVPYLDKFAVLKRSQGAGGVADIVFNAMVRTCFPRGVCWRSRRTNPVNKWYFERSRGTWKLPNTNWTMFWTTEGVPQNEQTFWDYEGVCRTIEPSWADKQKEAD